MAAGKCLAAANKTLKQRKEEVNDMSEKKEAIIETIGKTLPNMTENEKTYLMGFLEGVAALVGINQGARERPGA